MHPLIKILSFIAFSIFASVGYIETSLFALAILLFVWIITSSYPDDKSFIMLRRMKIFFISIFLIYLWFTPGELMFPVLSDWSPSYEGLNLAISRVLALCILVLGVTTLLRLAPKDELVCGLYYFSYPFSVVGLNRVKLITRVILTLDIATAPKVHEPKIIEKSDSVSSYINSLVDKFSEKIADSSKMNYPPEVLIVDILPPPSLKEWLVLLYLIIFFVTLLLII